MRRDRLLLPYTIRRFTVTDGANPLISIRIYRRISIRTIVGVRRWVGGVGWVATEDAGVGC